MRTRSPHHATFRPTYVVQINCGCFDRIDTAGVDLDVVNRYRWPTLVRYWDRYVLEDHGDCRVLCGPELVLHSSRQEHTSETNVAVGVWYTPPITTRKYVQQMPTKYMFFEKRLAALTKHLFGACMTRMWRLCYTCTASLAPFLFSCSASLL